jgi:uncharacterized SAM-binding protein YcdF (DUF218 family)
MFVFFSKLLPPFFYPVGLVCLLVLASILLRKRTRLHIWLLITALLLLFVGGNKYTATAIARSLEARIHAPDPIPAADVIVVLGGGTEANAPPRSMAEVNGAGDRILYTAKLYREGHAPAILVSGGNISWLSSRPGSPAEEMAEILEFVGVPGSAIWFQDKSQNTYEDALYSAEILNEKGISRIILVTSAMHMPRSYALFTAQGFDVIPAPADYVVPDYVWNDLGKGDFSAILVNLIPSASSLSMVTTCLKEYLGMLVYSLQGWL